MFPLINLRRHGLSGTHPRALRIWLTEDGGQISGVLCRSREGVVFPQLPGASPDGFSTAAAVLRSDDIKGCLGESEQVRALLAALGDQPANPELDIDEVLMTLELSALVVPPLPDSHLTPINSSNLAQARIWRGDYGREVLGWTEGEADERAERDIASYTAEDSHRLLIVGDRPVSMTGFNATDARAVQIGGVYTPPAFRGRGYARTAVGLHLAEARAVGADRAFLFTGSPSAETAYRALGFQRSGSYSLVMYRAPWRFSHG